MDGSSNSVLDSYLLALMLKCGRNCIPGYNIERNNKSRHWEIIPCIKFEDFGVSVPSEPESTDNMRILDNSSGIYEDFSEFELDNDFQSISTVAETFSALLGRSVLP